ncbi:MAG: hydroxyethylthiazole kinase [Candidatus Krumholzibacteriia bacterium]
MVANAIAAAVGRDLAEMRRRRPLVHNITNYVVMNSTANALLSVGALPVMAHAAEEVADMVAIADSLVLNIGTLSQPWLDSMALAGAAAGERGVPVVLDPVGAGATALRSAAARSLLATFPVAVVRGNASEIRALHATESGTRGVEASHASAEALQAARALSVRHQCVVVVSGAEDLVVEGERLIRIRNGHPLMPLVTGLGCTASALTGAFLAVNPDALRAAAHAMVVLGVAGELAAERAAGPGSLQMHLIDVLHTIAEQDVDARLRWEEG